jgi:hypothetical protein
MLLFLAVLMVGCAKVPQEDIDAAKAAVQAAKDAQADKYANADLQAAEDLINQVNTEVETQNAKFALFRSFDKAKELCTQAKAAGEKAKQSAIAGKEAAKKDAEASLAAAQSAVTAAKEILAKAPKGKDTKAEVEAMTADLTGLENALTQIQAQVSKEEFLDAAAKAKSAKEKADGITGQVQAAIDKRKGGKKK